MSLLIITGIALLFQDAYNELCRLAYRFLPRYTYYSSTTQRITTILQSIANLLGFARPTPGDPAPFPREWHDYLRTRMWQYSQLRDPHRRRIEQVVTHMVQQRHWTGGNGFAITDEMRVVIAGQAALMTLGLDEPYYFHRVPDIIVYPKAFFASHEQTSAWSTHPVFGTSVESPRLGEAWHRGPIVLAWDSIVDPYDHSGTHLNVVIHEFTHHLDGLDGDMSGTPPMSDVELEREWYRVTELDYLELVGQADRDEPTLLSHYGASNRAEFFAVATECFFDHPHDLRDQHDHLYEMLAKYFRQSPADFLRRAAQPPLRKVGAPQRKRGTRARMSEAVAADPFARGLAEFNDGDLLAAIASFTRAINDDTQDSEAYAARALAHLESDQLDQALADAHRALELDPDDYDALAVRGCVRVLTDELREGITDLRDACLKDDSALARTYLGRAYLLEGHPKKAVREFSLAIATDPADEQLYEWRAEAHRALGDNQRAERDEQKAVRLRPRQS